MMNNNESKTKEIHSTTVDNRNFEKMLEAFTAKIIKVLDN